MDIPAAVLIDAGYLWKVAARILSRHWKSQDIIDLSLACLKPDETLFRIFFYDCLPFEGVRLHPITNERIHYSNSEFYVKRCAFLKELAALDYVAFRKGRLSHKGWKLRDKALQSLIQGKKQGIEVGDLVEDFQQKTVDMKIGLDVAWLSSRNIVKTMIIIGCDTDYLPAMKHARREGSRVVVACFPQPSRADKPDLHHELLEHADECRLMQYQAGAFTMVSKLS